MKPWKEVIDGIRNAVLGKEVREDLAQMGEYVEQFANTAGENIQKAIDPTLSVSGKAADAAKVGERSMLFRSYAALNEPWSLSDYLEPGTYGITSSVAALDSPADMPLVGNFIVINEKGYYEGAYIKQTISTSTGYTNWRIVSIETKEVIQDWVGNEYLYRGYLNIDGVWKLSDYVSLGSYGVNQFKRPADMPSDAPAGPFTVFNERGYDGSYIKQTISTSTGYTNWRIVSIETKEVFQDWQGYLKIKVAVCGDSFSANEGGNKTMAQYLNAFPKYNAISLSTGGLSAQNWYTAWGDSITSDIDVAIIALGLNGTEEVGTANDTPSVTTTFSAAIKFIITKFLEKAPAARIILWGMDAWYAEERANALYDIAKIYGIECYCMKADLNIPIRISGKYQSKAPNLDAQYADEKTKIYQTNDDDLHPNAKARKMLAGYWSTLI